jgi:hypothetical protein
MLSEIYALMPPMYFYRYRRNAEEYQNKLKEISKSEENL